MSALLACLTAPGVEFETKEAWSAHYKSEWHRYNLRRKTAGLTMVSETEFEARRAAAAAAQPGQGSSSSAAIASKTNNKKVAHLKRAKHKSERSFNDAGGAFTKEPSFRATQPKPTIQGREAVYRDGERQPRNYFVDDVDKTAKADDEEEEDDMDEDFEPITAEARATDSIFDSMQFETIDESLEYMQQKYGFYMPEAGYLVQPEACLAYLCDKVKTHRVCLTCERVFRSFHACQQHMIDKAHAKIPYDTDEQVDELSEFYDFSSSYDAFDVQEDAIVPFEEDDEGWETASEGSDDEVSARKKARPRVSVMPTGELVVRRGRHEKKIIGARWLQRYYKQNMRVEDEREAVLAVRKEHNQRLLALYEKAGIDCNSVGFFARGMAAQFNRSLNKTIKRDQRMECRAQQARFGQKNGGNAKDWTWNTAIKNRVAGKNMGEGLGVHG